VSFEKLREILLVVLLPLAWGLASERVVSWLRSVRSRRRGGGNQSHRAGEGSSSGEAGGGKA
jgi:hypothetical protein